MAVDLTTGSYDEQGIFSKYNDIVAATGKCSTDGNFPSLKNFHTTRVIKESSESKMLVVEGRFAGDERPAIVVVEKMPFDTRDLTRLFTADSRLELKFRNNIYANYHVYPRSGFNGISIKVIHPAHESDFSEFIDQPLVMVKETIELYKHAIIEHFRSVRLEEKNKGGFLSLLQNEDRIIFRDADAITGFTLLKEEPKNCSCPSLHIRAIAQMQNTEWLSMRDLTAACIPWLVKLRDKCMEQLTSKYEIPSSKLECYIYYPPSSFPFHVFFETVQKDSPLPATNTHHLETIISNLKLIPDYYQKVTLTYSLPENNPLLSKFCDVQNNSSKDEYRNQD